MKNVRFILFPVLAIFFAASLAHAEDIEITINSGWSFNNADMEVGPCLECLGPLPPFISKTSIDDSMIVGFKVAYFLNERAGIEGSFAVAPNHDVVIQNNIFCRFDVCPLQPDYVPSFLFMQNMVTYNYDANFLYHLLTGNVEPYITIGVGGVASDLDNDTRNDFALNYGAGAKFWFKNIAVRFEINDHVIPDYFLTEETEHNLQVMYGFTFGL